MPQPAPVGGGEGQGEKDGKGAGGDPCPGLPPCDGGRPDQHSPGKCGCPCHGPAASGTGGGAGQGQGKDGDSDSTAGGRDAHGRPWNNWDRITVEAAKFAKGRGKLPGFAEGLVGEIQKPATDYKTILARYMSRTKKGEYSFRRLNRKYASQGMAMPSLHSYTADVLLHGDVSGSMMHFVKRMFGHIWSIASVVRCSVDVILSDTEITGVFRLKKPDDVLKIKPRGFGGTDFRACFDFIAGAGKYASGWNGIRVKRPELLIFITDLDGTFPDTRPSYKVLWVVPGGHHVRPPFGQVLEVPEE